MEKIKNLKLVNKNKSESKTTAETELALMDFELLYPIMVPEKTKKENSEWFTKHREKKWKEALKKSNGDEMKALSIYGEISS